VTVGAGKSRKYALEFKLDAGGGRAGVVRDMRGQACVLKIPVAIRRATPAEVAFVFEFKYSEKR
jgi:hypothetical protein